MLLNKTFFCKKKFFVSLFTTFCLTHKKMEIEDFKNKLIHLRVIIEEIEQRNIIERLETEKIEEINKKS